MVSFIWIELRVHEGGKVAAAGLRRGRTARGALGTGASSWPHAEGIFQRNARRFCVLGGRRRAGMCKTFVERMS